MSFPRAGRVCAAQIIAELGSVREGALPNPDALAMEAGCAPVTKQSGKSRAVVFRWACNRRLRAAVTCFADNSRHASSWAAQVYARTARQRGAATTPTPSASSPGSGCSGALGKTTEHTTPTSTAPPRRPPRVDTGCLTRQPPRRARPSPGHGPPRPPCRSRPRGGSGPAACPPTPPRPGRARPSAPRGRSGP